MKKDISVSVTGQDCGNHRWTAQELRKVAAVFAEAADALEHRKHGYIEERGLVHIGIDLGGPFSEKTGLPPIPRK